MGDEEEMREEIGEVEIGERDGIIPSSAVFSAAASPIEVETLRTAGAVKLDSARTRATNMLATAP